MVNGHELGPIAWGNESSALCLDIGSNPTTQAARDLAPHADLDWVPIEDLDPETSSVFDWDTNSNFDLDPGWLPNNDDMLHYSGSLLQDSNNSNDSNHLNASNEWLQDIDWLNSVISMANPDLGAGETQDDPPNAEAPPPKKTKLTASLEAGIGVADPNLIQGSHGIVVDPGAIVIADPSDNIDPENKKHDLNTANTDKNILRAIEHPPLRRKRKRKRDEEGKPPKVLPRTPTAPSKRGREEGPEVRNPPPKKTKLVANVSRKRSLPADASAAPPSSRKKHKNTHRVIDTTPPDAIIVGAVTETPLEDMLQKAVSTVCSDTHTLGLMPDADAIIAGAVTETPLEDMLKKAVYTVCSDTHTLGLMPDGSLYSKHNQTNYAVYLRFPLGRTVTQLAAGDDLCAALTDGGQLYVWGALIRDHLAPNDKGCLDLVNGSSDILVQTLDIPHLLPLENLVRVDNILAVGSRLFLHAKQRVYVMGRSLISTGGYVSKERACKKKRSFLFPPRQVRRRITKVYAEDGHCFLKTTKGQILQWDLKQERLSRP